MGKNGRGRCGQWLAMALGLGPWQVPRQPERVGHVDVVEIGVQPPDQIDPSIQARIGQALVAHDRTAVSPRRTASRTTACLPEVRSTPFLTK